MRPSKKFQKGFSMLELTIVLALLILLTTAVVLFVNPDKQSKKARDEKRLSDLSTIDRAISEFVLNNSRYPDQEDILRMSNTLPSGSTDLNKSNPGWIFDDLSPYLEKLPTDPLNDDQFFYTYMQSGTSYEINAKLEDLTDEMINDGGNDPNLYEIGNNLNLISY